MGSISTGLRDHLGTPSDVVFAQSTLLPGGKTVSLCLRPKSPRWVGGALCVPCPSLPPSLTLYLPSHSSTLTHPLPCLCSHPPPTVATVLLAGCVQHQPAHVLGLAPVCIRMPPYPTGPVMTVTTPNECSEHSLHACRYSSGVVWRPQWQHLCRSTKVVPWWCPSTASPVTPAYLKSRKVF